jgi:hypothetical protein
MLGTCRRYRKQTKVSEKGALDTEALSVFIKRAS